MSKNYYIIPIFISHQGCPHQCVFCNQDRIAGVYDEVTAEDVASDVKGLKFFGKEDNEKLNDESNADSIYVISQKTGASEVRKF